VNLNYSQPEGAIHSLRLGLPGLRAGPHPITVKQSANKTKAYFGNHRRPTSHTVNVPRACDIDSDAWASLKLEGYCDLVACQWPATISPPGQVSLINRVFQTSLFEVQLGSQLRPQLALKLGHEIVRELSWMSNRASPHDLTSNLIPT
jgi:hypothetical protein